MAYVDFITPVHKKTVRDYLGRVNEFPKAEASAKARLFGEDYWDGDRRFGYGGYCYDGRWQPVAQSIARHYGLKKGDRVLDVGCGKAFLLHDLAQTVPGLRVDGIDVSRYAIEHAPEPVRPYLVEGSAEKLPYPDKTFDLVISINTLHNLSVEQLDSALREIMRVGRRYKYVCVESFRNEAEKVNLLYWQLTCRGFYAPEEWQWWFSKTGYDGDHSFIFFE